MTDGRGSLGFSLNHDSRRVLELVMAEPGQWDAMPNKTGSEIHALLRELRHRRWIEGRDQSGDGSVYWWSQMNPTLEGLREFGEYPQTGREHLPGRWDDGVWGRVDRPVLEVLSNLPDSAPHFALRPDNSVSLDEWRQWEAHKRLIAAGVLEAETQESGLADCRVTGRGRNVLNPPADDPLDRAHRELFQGSKVEAVTAAVNS